MLKQRGRQMHPGFGTPEYTLASCPVLASVGRAGHNGPCHHDEGWHPWSPDHLLALVPTLLTSHTLHRVPVQQWCSGHLTLCPHKYAGAGPLSPVSPPLTRHRRRWRCQHKPDTFSANLSECQPAPGREPWGVRRSRQQFLIL